MFHRVKHVCMHMHLSDKTMRWKHHSNKHFGSSGTVSYTNKYALPKTADKLVGSYPREMKSYVHTETCTQIFVTAFPEQQKKKLEGTQMSVKGVSDGRTMVQSRH